MLSIALPLYVLAATRSAFMTAAAFMVSTVVRLICGQAAGILVDRFDHRRTFVAMTLLQAAGLAPLIVLSGRHPIMWVLYVVTAGQSLLGTAAGPAANALIPAIVPRELRAQANSLAGFLRDLAQMIGGSAGGLILGTVGLRVVVAADALTFLVTAALIARPFAVPTSPPGQRDKGRRRVLDQWREGITVTRRDRRLVGTMLVGFVTFFGNGLYIVLYAVFALHDAHIPEAYVGILRSVVTVGTLAGGALIAVVGSRFTARTLVFLGLVGTGIAMLLAWNGPLLDVPPAYYILVFAVAGVPNVAAYAGISTIFQDATPQAAFGRVYSLFGGVTGGASLMGLSLAGSLATWLPIRLVLNIQALMFFVGGLVGWLMLRPVPRHARQRFGGRRCRRGVQFQPDDPVDLR